MIKSYPMKLHKLFLLAISGLIISVQAKAQLPEGFKAEVEVQAIGTTNKVVPFWMRSNQYGSVPLNGASGSLLGRISRDYESIGHEKKKLLDWGFGFEGRANGGKGSNVTIIESYLKGRLGIFQLKGGRSKDVMGLNGDTSLSSGSFAVSGNALGIPKIELSIPDYYRIPVFDGLFSFKGYFSHGWVGRAKIIASSYTEPENATGVDVGNRGVVTYFHQKALYGRLGKEDWKFNLYAGFSHQVYWGNEKDSYGSSFKLTPIETFFYVATGKAYGANGVPTSKIGNQIGSIDIGGEYNFSGVRVMLYRQSFYDVGALSKLANISDGLNGITFSNNYYDDDSKSGFQWKSLLFELFYSKDQAGYPWSTPTKSGDEDYYNNFFYTEGWSYKSMGLGNPLITRREDAKKGQAIRSDDYFLNNRVLALHAGFSGKYKSLHFIGKASYSKNYGTFGTSIYGKSTGNIRFPQTKNVFKTVNQISLYLDVLKEIKPNYNLGIAMAIDQGNLLNNSVGIAVKLNRSF
jgi:hypothetical protein